MKRTAMILAMAAIALYGILVTAVVLTPLNPYGGGGWCNVGCDFVLRMNEIDCLMRGANPYDVWIGDIVKEPYLPEYGRHKESLEARPEFTERITVYAPWEYIMMMPFALMPRTFSWIVYFAVMLASLWLVFRVGRSFGRRFVGTGRENASVVGAVAVLLVALPAYQNFQSGNLAVPVLLAAAYMSVYLNRGCDEMVSLCWAFAMMKPNLGLLFAVPLLLRRKFAVCCFAAGLCATATLVASFVGNASPFDLVWQTTAANSSSFVGCGTLPYFLSRLLPVDAAIITGVSVGLVLCILLTLMLIRAGYRDWLILLMPAAVIGAGWTYSQCYCFTMNWFFFAVLAASLFKHPRSRFLRWLAVLSVLFMTRVYNLFHSLVALVAGPGFEPASPAHFNADSLVSSAGLVLCAALCCWLAKNKSDERRRLRIRFRI